MICKWVNEDNFCMNHGHMQAYLTTFIFTPVSFGTSTVPLLRGENHANIQARPRLSMTMWVQKSTDFFLNVCRLEDKIGFHVPVNLADSERVSVFYKKEVCTVSCVKDVVITPTIAMMLAGFSMESSLFLDKDMLRVLDDQLCNVQDVRLIRNQGLCEQRLNPGQLLILIDISKLC